MIGVVDGNTRNRAVMSYPRQLLEEQEAMIVVEIGRGFRERARAMLDAVRGFWFAHAYAYRWLELERRVDPYAQDDDDDAWTAEDYMRAMG